MPECPEQEPIAAQLASKRREYANLENQVSVALKEVADPKELFSRLLKKRLKFTAYLCRRAGRNLNHANGKLIDRKHMYEAQRCRAAWLHLQFALLFIEGKIVQDEEFEESPDLKRVMDAIEQAMGDEAHLERQIR